MSTTKAFHFNYVLHCNVHIKNIDTPSQLMVSMRALIVIQPNMHMLYIEHWYLIAKVPRNYIDALKELVNHIKDDHSSLGIIRI